MSKERGLICCAESVRGFLENRKSQTRRIIKPQPKKLNERIFGFPVGQYSNVANIKNNLWVYQTKRWRPNRNSAFRQVSSPPFKCPYGQVGDRLWVRETFVIENPEYYGYDYELPTDRPIEYHGPEKTQPLIPHYRATEPEPNIVPIDDIEDELDDRTRWRPSIFMSKWAARIWLEITNIRVERVQDIDENGACAEGCELYTSETNLGPVRTFERLWDSLHAKRGFGWDKNPWVWVLEFKRIKILKDKVNEQ